MNDISPDLARAVHHAVIEMETSLFVILDRHWQSGGHALDLVAAVPGKVLIAVDVQPPGTGDPGRDLADLGEERTGELRDAAEAWNAAAASAGMSRSGLTSSGGPATERASWRSSTSGRRAEMAAARDALDHALPGDALNDALDVLVAESAAEGAGGVASVQWAEEEIEAAIRRHPGAASDLWYSFRLLVPAVSCTGWGTEFVIRGHARELLERVAAGADTRPGTAAECAMAMAAVSVKIPLHGAAAGFYCRMWRQAFPGQPAWPDGDQSADVVCEPFPAGSGALEAGL